MPTDVQGNENSGVGTRWRSQIAGLSLTEWLSAWLSPMGVLMPSPRGGAHAHASTLQTCSHVIDGTVTVRAASARLHDQPDPVPSAHMSHPTHTQMAYQ